ncbi:MAG: T9SS type A sorting domain-containing protein, partial [Chlorobi bacterium]|nr:T9SS type A sorting domain-containing protein [Chlorobiota bacterium]
FECVLTIQLRFPQSTGDVRNNLVKRAPSNPYEPIVRLRDGATFIKNQANLVASNADFVKPGGPQAQKDLHLASGSSAIDAGVNLGNLVPVDFEGQPRPAGNAYDVGADELGIVPVELLSFTARESQGGVTLHWITASETGNYGFEIQRKTASDSFTTIGFVPGNGTTVDRHAYTYRDKVPFPRPSGLAYRLRQIDFDGSEHFYPVVELPAVPGSAPRMDALYPNPVAKSAGGTITVPVFSPESFSLSVYDVRGRRMLVPAARAYEPGSWSIRLPVSTLPAGKYIIVLESGSKTLSRMFSITAR